MNYGSTLINIIPASNASDNQVLGTREGFTICVLTPGRVCMILSSEWHKHSYIVGHRR